MYSTDRELSFIGAPILLDNVCLIKPKTVLDKIKLGYKYDTCLGLLTLSSSDIEDILFKKLGADMKELASITPFEYLLLSADNNETFFMELKEAFVTFIQEDIHIIPKAGIVLVGDLNNQFIIEEFFTISRSMKTFTHISFTFTFIHFISITILFYHILIIHCFKF